MVGAPKCPINLRNRKAPDTGTATRLTKQFARENGYAGDSPAMLKAFEDIRQHGIREARKGHYERKRIVDQYKDNPGLFFAAIRPALSTDEAIEDARHFLIAFRNMPTWRKQGQSGQACEVKQRIVLARYFRRFGERIWARRAA